MFCLRHIAHICLYSTLFTCKPSVFQHCSFPAQRDLGEVPRVKHSSALPVSFVCVFAEHCTILYVFSFLRGCAFSKDSNCVFTLSLTHEHLLNKCRLSGLSYKMCFNFFFLHFLNFLYFFHILCM